MDIVTVVDAMLDDLALVAASAPNERLPKEEQVRCSVYAAIRPHFHVVCAERGYGSIDDGSRAECDLWAQAPGRPPVWIEFKRCWSARGWNNKPPEQRAAWEADVAKLRQLPTDSDRYFLLVGCFDCDPTCDAAVARAGVAGNVRRFYPAHLIRSATRAFLWRQGDGITQIAVWVWRWSPGVPV